MRIQDLRLDPECSPQSYVGTELTIDGEQHRIGKLLDIGEHKLIFRLENADGQPARKVLKIYRDLSGNVARREQSMNYLLEGGPIEHHSTEVCAVSGGFVGVQREVEGIRVTDPTTGQERAFNTSHTVRANLSTGEIEIISEDSWLTGRTSHEGDAARAGSNGLDVGELVQAIEALDKHGFDLASKYRVLLYIYKEDYDEAYQTLRRLRELDPANHNWAVLLADCCVVTHRTDEALSMLRFALSADPQWLDGWYHLAQVRAYLGAFEAAREALHEIPVTPETADRLDELRAEIAAREAHCHGRLPVAGPRRGDSNEAATEGRAIEHEPFAHALPPTSWLVGVIERIVQADAVGASELLQLLGEKAIELYGKGEVNGALELMKRKELLARQIKDDSHLQTALGDQALMLTRAGQHDNAMRLLLEREEVCKRINDLCALAHCIGGQSIVAENRGDFDESMEFLKKQEQLYRELNDPGQLSATIHNQALLVVQRMRRPASDALPLVVKACEIAKRTGDLEIMQEMEPFAVTLVERVQREAFRYYDTSDFSTAKELFRTLEHLCRLLERPDLLQAVLGNLSLVLKHAGEIDDAMALLTEQEDMCRSCENQSELQGCLGNKALVLKAKGDFEAALNALDEQETLCRGLADRRALALCLGSRGQILVETGDTASAIAAHLEEENICRKEQDRSGLERSWSFQMSILLGQRRLQEALSLLRRQEQAYREWDDSQGLAVTLYNRATLVMQHADAPLEALPLLREAYLLAARLQQVSLVEKAQMLLASIVERISKDTVSRLQEGNLDRALCLSEKQEQACSELAYSEGLQDAWENRAAVLQMKGEFEDALLLLKKQSEVCRDRKLLTDLVRSLITQAFILADQLGRVRDAMPMVEEAYRISQNFEMTQLREYFAELAERCLNTLQNAFSDEGARLVKHGDAQAALMLFREQEQFFRKLGRVDGVATACAYQAWILSEKMNRQAEASELAEASHRLAIEHDLIDLAERIEPIVGSVRAKLPR